MKCLLAGLCLLWALPLLAEEEYVPRFHRTDRVRDRFTVEVDFLMKTEFTGKLFEQAKGSVLSGKIAAEVEIVAVGPSGYRAAVKATVRRVEVRSDGAAVAVFQPGDVLEVSQQERTSLLKVNGGEPTMEQGRLGLLAFPVVKPAPDELLWSAFAPAKKVKAGDEWPADKEKLIRAIDSKGTFKQERLTGSCRLLSVGEGEHGQVLQLKMVSRYLTDEEKLQQKSNAQMKFTQQTIERVDEGDFPLTPEAHPARQKVTFVTDTHAESPADPTVTGSSQITFATEVREHPLK